MRLGSARLSIIVIGEFWQICDKICFHETEVGQPSCNGQALIANRAAAACISLAAVHKAGWFIDTCLVVESPMAALSDRE